MTAIKEPTRASYFAYNAAGLVARIRWGDASSTYFLYDGNLQRYGIQQSTTSLTTTYFLWDGPNLLQEQNADGTVKEEHTNVETQIAGIGQLVETRRPGQAQEKLFPIMDPRGSITKWMQSDGNTVFASREYDAFGNLIFGSSTGTWPGRQGYQGQWWQEIKSNDGQQSLNLSDTRVQEPATGRFLQNEPLLSKRPASHYLYSAQNPMSFVDPTGQDEKQRDLLQRLINGNRLTKEQEKTANRFIKEDKFTDDYWAKTEPAFGYKLEQEAAYRIAQKAWKDLEYDGVVDPGYVRWGPFDPSSPIERNDSKDPCTPKERWEKEQSELRKEQERKEAAERENRLNEMREMERARRAMGRTGPSAPGMSHHGLPTLPNDPDVVRESNAGRQMPSAPFYDTGGRNVYHENYGPSMPENVPSVLLTSIPLFGPLMIVPITIRDLNRIAQGNPVTIASYGLLPIKVVTSGIGPIPGAGPMIRDMGFPIPKNIFYPQGGLK